MAELSIDIEKLVREVMAELRLSPQGDAAPGAAPSAEAPAASARRGSPDPAETAGQQGSGEQGRPSVGAVARSGDRPQREGDRPQREGDQSRREEKSRQSEGELVLGARVVTLADLADRLVGVRRLVVTPQAVVTPAVRDELLRRNIPLVFGEAEPAEASGSVRLVTIATGTTFDPAGLLRALEVEGIATESQRLDCLIATVDALVVELAKERTLGLLLTRHTAAALCLANRVHGVRAVWGLDVGGVARDAAAVGANLLVVDPAAAGVFRLKQLVLQFCRLGRQACPEVFSQRLG